MVNSSDNLGGASFSNLQAREFKECISKCSLLDLGFFGPKFTWFRNNLKEQPDRSLYNAEWLNYFLESTSFHLERLNSGHRPILVRFLTYSRYIRAPHPFHLNAAWLGHEKFTSFLDQS
ncbi:hypothetical protein LINPERHAP1_LOCUS39709 [Linum perenne]